MRQLPSPDYLLSEILALQKDIYANEKGKIYVVKDNYLGEFSKSENSVRLIFDHVNFKILQISDNVEKLWGYPAKDFLESQMLFPFKLLTLEHYNFLYEWLKWVLTRHYKYGDTYKAQQAMCGIKVNHKNGSVMRFLVRQNSLEETKEGIPTISAVTLDDVTHLIKADFYWGRIECGKEKRAIHHLFSMDKKDIPNDILSPREKETVILIAEGKESKEIGKLLHISQHTVDNHRRNMIAKIGVRDTTGLVQICKMIGII
jgi:DNA-binding CsgD family transcriptional regulator